MTRRSLFQAVFVAPLLALFRKRPQYTTIKPVTTAPSWKPATFSEPGEISFDTYWSEANRIEVGQRMKVDLPCFSLVGAEYCVKQVSMWPDGRCSVIAEPLRTQEARIRVTA